MVSPGAAGFPAFTRLEQTDPTKANDEPWVAQVNFGATT